MKTSKKSEPINIYLPDRYLIPSVLTGILIGVVSMGLLLS